MIVRGKHEKKILVVVSFLGVFDILYMVLSLYVCGDIINNFIANLPGIVLNIIIHYKLKVAEREYYDINSTKSPIGILKNEYKTIGWIFIAQSLWFLLTDDIGWNKNFLFDMGDLILILLNIPMLHSMIFYYRPKSD